MTLLTLYLAFSCFSPVCWGHCIALYIFLSFSFLLMIDTHAYIGA